MCPSSNNFHPFSTIRFWLWSLKSYMIPCPFFPPILWWQLHHFNRKTTAKTLWTDKQIKKLQCMQTMEWHSASKKGRSSYCCHMHELPGCPALPTMYIKIESQSRVACQKWGWRSSQHFTGTVSIGRRGEVWELLALVAACHWVRAKAPGKW